MKSVLAIDQGTTGSTCMILDEDGMVRGKGYREFTQYFPEPGWVEHDAEEIWQRTLDAHGSIGVAIRSRLVGKALIFSSTDIHYHKQRYTIRLSNTSTGE